MIGEIHGCKEENAHSKHSVPQNSQLYFRTLFLFLFLSFTCICEVNAAGFETDHL
jgi:hypothetical protein